MSSFVKPEWVHLDRTLTSKDAMLDFLSKRASELGISKNEQKTRTAFNLREEEGGTGLVDGFVIPHAKDDSIESAAVLVVRSNGTIDDWAMLDDSRAFVAIGLLVPGAEAGTTHLKLLARIAEMLLDEDVRQFISTSTNPTEIATMLNDRLG